MKKIFLVLAAVVSLSGCGFFRAPEAVVIVTDKARAQSLITSLQATRSGLESSKVAVRLVKKNSPAEVLRALDWAAVKGVKVVGLDGDAYAPGDPAVGPRLKAMREAGVYVAAMEFVE